MKPNWLNQQEYDRLLAEGREGCRKEKMPLIDKIIEVAAAGQWLWEELGKLGLDDEKKYSITFAHGQACFPLRDPWETARVILEQTKADKAPKGGADYGDALLNGEVEGLPRGGLQIIRMEPTEQPVPKAEF
jgi:hypothetical protein